MWKPVSGLAYEAYSPEGQVIVVYNHTLAKYSRNPKYVNARRDRWRDRACAAIASSAPVRGVVLDILANPQVRAIVFDHVPPGWSAPWRDWFSAASSLDGVADDHVALVRQFVDLYDDDFRHKGPLQPFWPERILYDDGPRPG